MQVMSPPRLTGVIGRLVRYSEAGGDRVMHVGDAGPQYPTGPGPWTWLLGYLGAAPLCVVVVCPLFPRIEMN